MIQFQDIEFLTKVIYNFGWREEPISSVKYDGNTPQT